MIRLLPALCLSAFLFIGCTTRAQLSYKPVVPVQESKNIALKLENFSDERREKETVGAIRNLYGMPIVTIKTDSDVPQWMSYALKSELTNAGYDILDNSQYVIEGRIKRVSSSAHFLYHGSIRVEIALRKDGKVVFSKFYKTDKGGGINWIASPAQCMNTLERNLQTVCKQFINDLSEHFYTKE